MTEGNSRLAIREIHFTLLFPSVLLLVVVILQFNPVITTSVYATPRL